MLYPMPVQSQQLSAATVVITVSGRLVLGKDVELLQKEVQERIDAGENKVFILDLTALEYADSSGLGTLISCLNAIKTADAEMRLAGANPRIRRIFNLTGVDRLMLLFPTLAAATAGSST